MPFELGSQFYYSEQSGAITRYCQTCMDNAFSRIHQSTREADAISFEAKCESRTHEAKKDPLFQCTECGSSYHQRCDILNPYLQPPGLGRVCTVCTNSGSSGPGSLHSLRAEDILHSPLSELVEDGVRNLVGTINKTTPANEDHSPPQVELLCADSLFVRESPPIWRIKSVDPDHQPI
ncbi:unnamed protein product, partial [Ectocarpus sp. 8 AP-2014]